MKRNPATSLVTAAFLAAICLTPTQAADIRNVLEGYSITSWLQKDGLPPSVIWAVAQDKEGYLWLGTDVGLVRFDGVRFAVWQPSGPTLLPKGPVRTLHVAAGDGSIWLGLGEPGGVSRIRINEVRNYGESDGLAAGAITMLVEDSNGDIWAGNREGLFRFVNDRWESSGDGLPKVPLHRTYVDRHGVRFVATAQGLYRRGAAQTRFQYVDGFDGAVRDVAEDAHGRVWVADPLVGFRRLDESRASSPERGRGSRLLRDSKGNLWVGTFGQGLWRVAFESDLRPAAVQRTTSVTGFSDDGVASLLEDRDGNIWAATYDGLNRLTPHKITPVMNLGVMSGVEETRDGSVWVGTADGLIEFPPGALEPRRQLQNLEAPPSAMHADRAGALWVATERQLLKVVGGNSSVVPLPGPLQRINSITSDVKKRIWLTDREHGVFRLDDGRLESLELPAEVQGVQVMCSLGDQSGRVWLLFANGRVALVDDGGRVVLYGRQDGLTGGVYRAIHEDHDGVVWLGGNEGLTRFANGTFVTMGASNGIPEGSIIAVMGDEAGVLWLGLEGVGIVRMDPDELRKVVADVARHQVRYSFFDKFDGFAGAPRWFGNSSTARGEDGRLWFVSARGVTIVDPRTIEENRPRPVRVSIEGILADGLRVPFAPQTRLPSGTTRIEIDYTVPNLAAPLKTRFRYQLEGFDADWVDAGTRRQAFYTNLPARHYRFHVIASNSDGTWTEPDVVWDFSISPKFYQTSWFLATCIGTFLIVPWAAWRLRIRQVRKQFSMLLGERARLSREIHDTLLQGLVGVAIRCDAIANDDASATDTRDRLLRLRRDAEDYIRDARRSILDLRSPKLQSSDLAGALRRAGERAVAGSHVTFKLTVTGTPSKRWANVEEQLFRIGQEALLNAVRHAQASEVRIELQYNKSSVVLRISDDGRGFDLGLVHEEDSHFGLLSMKERAEAVGGKLKIASEVGRGAEVEAFVPIA